MVSNFLADWDLFYAAFLAGWLIAALLGLVGVIVVARNQIFIGAAISQGSTLGIAVALAVAAWLALDHDSWVRSDPVLSAMAVVAAVGAALVTAWRSSEQAASYEAITGWVYLFSASGSILLLAHSPHGLDEIMRLLSSSVIGATDADLIVFAALLLVTATGLIVFYRSIALLAVDPAMAPVLGLSGWRWSLMLCAWLGLCVGLSIRVSGMLYVFGLLVLPALVAKHCVREVRSLFVVAPLIALAVAVAGFVLAHEYDYPPAQMVVALLSGLFLLVWLIQPRRWF